MHDCAHGDSVGVQACPHLGQFSVSMKSHQPKADKPQFHTFALSKRGLGHLRVQAVLMLGLRGSCLWHTNRQVLVSLEGNPCRLCQSGKPHLAGSKFALFTSQSHTHFRPIGGESEGWAGRSDVPANPQHQSDHCS